MPRQYSVAASFLTALCAASCAPGDDPDSARSVGTTAEIVQPENRAEIDVKTSNQHVRDECDEMVRVLKLSDEHAQQFDAILDDREKFVSHWVDEKGEQLIDYQTKMFDAAKLPDMDEVRNWKQKTEALRKEFDDGIEKYKVEIAETLPEQKRFEWDAYKLSERLLRRMELLNLSDQQKNDVRTQANETVREFAKTTNRRSQVFLQVEGDVVKNVLSLKQREAYLDLKRRLSFRSPRR